MALGRLKKGRVYKDVVIEDDASASSEHCLAVMLVVLFVEMPLYLSQGHLLYQLAEFAGHRDGVGGSESS